MADSNMPTVVVPDDAESIVQDAVHYIEELKGRDLRLIDVRDLTPLTDFMLIVTGTSNRHVKSLADNVVLQAKKSGQPPVGVEGLDQGDWVLVDLGAVVVHIMQAQARAFYQLEKLWLGGGSEDAADTADNDPEAAPQGGAAGI